MIIHLISSCGYYLFLGMRFAIAHIEVALAQIVQNFHIKLLPLHKPIVIDPKTLLSFPIDGILIQLEVR